MDDYLRNRDKEGFSTEARVKSIKKGKFSDSRVFIEGCYSKKSLKYE